jgi:tetratricopeptide (TPR) repeat protein
MVQGLLMPHESLFRQWALLFVLSAYLSAVLPIDLVRAAPPASESREYQRAIRSAVEEFDAGNFPEARALFTRAHALFPNARTYRGLGFVAFELRNYRDCVEYLETALRSADRPLEGEPRRSTEDLLARARGMIAKVELQVTPHPESVLLDGVPTTQARSEALVLEVGDHTLEVRAPGYLSERRTLKIAGGEHLHVAIQMRSAEAEPAQGPRIAAPRVGDTAEARDAAPERRWYKSPWLWTSVAIVAAGAGVGAYFLLRHDDPSTRARAPTMTANTPPDGVLQALGSF